MTPHSAFTAIRCQPIPALRLEVQEYRHRATGARHIHLATSDDHNVFLVAFLTVPQDSTGVAHILEHTALCGSQRYPVRDPFFLMTRRSLSTFMNAFTSSDWTAYPFASRNRKDFDNLLAVYLDAVFFPTLDPLDFAQEGHRLEWAEPADPNSALTIKGVVFNEMKGALSSPVQHLAQELQSQLFPTTTYHYNSGGDPAVMPELTHAQLKAFHARHYHPSNAVFMTYGDLPAAHHQAQFEDQALHRFQALELDLRVPDETRFTTPRRAEARYASNEAETCDKTHIVLAWLLDKATDPLAVLRTRILADVLLDNSSSPLRHALETSTLGNAPSPLCGFDNDTRETTFVCGLEGSDPEQAQAVEDLVLATLARVAEQGVPPEHLATALHQLELNQREIGGDGFPYGLHLILEALTPALHGGDPAAALDLEPHLAALRADLAKPDFVQQLTRRLLLDNPHRVRLVMRPDPQLGAQQAQREKARLATLRAALNAQDKTRITTQAQALAARQSQLDDPECLPKVALRDIPTELAIPAGRTEVWGALPVTWYGQGVNGLVYQQLVMELPVLDDDLLDLLPLYTFCLTEVGSGGRDYLATQALQAAVTGGLNVRCMARGGVADVQQTRSVLVLAGKALARNAAALTELMTQTLHAVRFDELPRLRELIAQQRAQREESVTDYGHVLALMAASAGLSPAAALQHRWNGLRGLQLLRATDDSLDDPAGLGAFAERLARLHAAVQSAPRQLLVIGDAEQHAPLAATIADHWRDEPKAAFTPLTPVPVRYRSQQGWRANATVNFCARVYPAVAPAHPDAPVLEVLGDFLRNGYLHRAVREQGGAYGVGAGYHGDSGAFRYYSYRDPRLAETLADFDRALAWLHSDRHGERALEEAILGVIAAIDRPSSPAGEATNAFFDALFGRVPAQRRAFRERILQVTLADLERVAAAYLQQPEQASTVVVGDPTALSQCTDLEMLTI